MQEQKSDNFIKLENEWFLTKDKEQSLIQKYGDNGIYNLFTYAFMRLNLNNYNNTMTIHASDIFRILSIGVTNTRVRKYIVDAIKSMNGDLYTIYEDFSCIKILDIEKFNSLHTYYAKLTNRLEGNFFIVYAKELYNIIQISNKHKFEFGSLFAHFAYICKSFGNKEKEDNYKTCFPSIETIGKNTGITPTTIIKYNKVFIENKILLIGNAGKENDEKNLVNIYARPDNQEQFDNTLNIQKGKVPIKYDYKNRQDQENKQRSLKQDIIKYKRANKIEDDNIDNITEEQWKRLNELERIWYNHLTVIRCKEVKRGAKLITITLKGKNKSYYTGTETEENCNNYKWGTQITLSHPLIEDFECFQNAVT